MQLQNGGGGGGGGEESAHEMEKESRELKMKGCLCCHRAERELADALDRHLKKTKHVLFIYKMLTNLLFYSNWTQKVDPIFYLYYHLNQFQFLTHLDQYNTFFLTPTKCYIGTRIHVDPDSFDKTSIRQIVMGFLELRL